MIWILLIYYILTVVFLFSVVSFCAQDEKNKGQEPEIEIKDVWAIILFIAPFYAPVALLLLIFGILYLSFEVLYEMVK